MRFSSSCAALALSAVVGSAQPLDTVPRAADEGLATGYKEVQKLAKDALHTAKKQIKASNGSCTWDNVRIRREWSTLCPADKKAYIAAVQCLTTRQALTPSELVPGAKTRFDDFVATHINQTGTIHYTGNFLSWHRFFTWSYEEALRTECGYTGTQPYWDWAKTAMSEGGLEASPLFDGSETSMSGNGEFIPDREDIILGASSGLPPVYLPPGSGGGCVTSGPFVNFTVNLGPVALDLPGGVIDSLPSQFQHNPRCLKRDLTNYCTQTFANASAVLSVVSDPVDVDGFQMQMQGVPGTGNIGVHGGGHYSLGGDPGRDLFVSPGDPAFYMHHSMIDRVWWMWQMGDPEARQWDEAVALAGTRTQLNIPPSEDATFEDYVDLYYAAGPAQKIGDLMSTYAGPFCYVYA